MTRAALEAMYESWRNENEKDLQEFDAVMTAAAADPEQKTDGLVFAAADLQRAAFIAGVEYASK